MPYPPSQRRISTAIFAKPNASHVGKKYIEAPLVLQSLFANGRDGGFVRSVRLQSCDLGESAGFLGPVAWTLP